MSKNPEITPGSFWPNEEAEPKPSYTFTPHNGEEFSPDSIMDPPLPVTAEQLNVLRGLALPVHELHEQVSRQGDTVIGTQQVAEISVKQILQTLVETREPREVTDVASYLLLPLDQQDPVILVWEGYLVQIVRANSSYRGDSGIARELGPTLDFRIEAGTLQAVQSPPTEDT